MHCHPIGCVQMYWPGDQPNLRTGLGTGPCQSKAHFSGAVVAQVSNRVDGLYGRARGDYHPAPFQ